MWVRMSVWTAALTKLKAKQSGYSARGYASSSIWCAGIRTSKYSQVNYFFLDLIEAVCWEIRLVRSTTQKRQCQALSLIWLFSFTKSTFDVCLQFYLFIFDPTVDWWNSSPQRTQFFFLPYLPLTVLGVATSGGSRIFKHRAAQWGAKNNGGEPRGNKNFSWMSV